MMENIKIVEPMVLAPEDLTEFKWGEKIENRLLYWHLIEECQMHPTIFLAHDVPQEDSSLEIHFNNLAKEFNNIGINAFMPMHPVPLSAFAQVMAKKAAPISIYLTEVENKLKLTFLGSNGALFDERNFRRQKPKEAVVKPAVIGATNIIDDYISDLSALADTTAETNAQYKELLLPFPEIKEGTIKNTNLKSLTESPSGQFSASINSDGQSIEIFNEKSEKIEAKVMAKTIYNYLGSERFASGTVIGPSPLCDKMVENEDFLRVEDKTQLHYNGAYTDLLLGWWHDGTISHQGCSSFGDTLVTALYFIEAVNAGYF